jgi:hypothetical protein
MKKPIVEEPKDNNEDIQNKLDTIINNQHIIANNQKLLLDCIMQLIPARELPEKEVLRQDNTQ